MENGERYLAVAAGRLYNARGNVVGTIESIRDITDPKRSEQEREHLITELQDAIAEIRTLSGLLPIRSSCKKNRDDKLSGSRLFFIKKPDCRPQCPPAERYSHYVPYNECPSGNGPFS